MKDTVYIDVEVRTTVTAELWPQDFEEVYADGKRECLEQSSGLVDYMYYALVDKIKERVDGYDIKYNEGDLDYLESRIEAFIEEKEGV